MKWLLMEYDMMDEIQERTSPLRIFLCHSSGDKPEVRNLYQRLSSDGFNRGWMKKIFYQDRNGKLRFQRL